MGEYTPLLGPDVELFGLLVAGSGSEAGLDVGTDVNLALAGPNTTFIAVVWWNSKHHLVHIPCENIQIARTRPS